MTDIEAREKAIVACEETIAALENKRVACVTRGTELADERANVALAAHTGDTKAAKRLESIHQAIVVHGSELASLDAALKAAAQKLVAAKATAARAEEKASALALRSVVKEFAALGRNLDSALDDLVEGSAQVRDLVNRIHNYGAGVPSHEQVLSLGSRAILAALMATVWARSFEHLPPNQRYRFGQLFGGWAAQVERHIAQVLGEDGNEEAA